MYNNNYVVLKLYIRRDKDFDIKRYEGKLEEINGKLLNLSYSPSVLPLIKLEVTDKCIYLAHQYISYNLNDRFHTHPFLNDIEKKWLTYQMLKSVEQLHSIGIRHGDIKSDNFLLTTWNWVFLVDIAFYKPTFLPVDNPADYNFYFENMGPNSRRR